jgi:hypothetical protein
MSVDAVWLLWHISRDEDQKLIGVYRTEADALAAIDRLKDKPGFSEAGGKFEIARYELNKDHWTEGLIRGHLPTWFRPDL